MLTMTEQTVPCAMHIVTRSEKLAITSMEPTLLKAAQLQTPTRNGVPCLMEVSNSFNVFLDASNPLFERQANSAISTSTHPMPE
jgi:hypothetical protein